MTTMENITAIFTPTTTNAQNEYLHQQSCLQCGKLRCIPLSEALCVRPDVHQQSSCARPLMCHYSDFELLTSQLYHPFQPFLGLCTNLTERRVLE